MAWCPLGAVLIAALGCGPGMPFALAPVEGTVTRQGQPLAHGRVVFQPQQGTPGPVAIGVIEPDGKFRMQTAGHDGVAMGQHLVTVHCREESNAAASQTSKQLLIPKSLIPEKYSNEATSPLRFEVKEGKNEYPIVLE
jgi:hypothetical protein